MRHFVLGMTLLALAGCASMSGPIPGGMSENDIAGIVTAANEGEIAQGQVASQRASSADVRAFGQMMVTDHTNALQKGQQVFASRGITPADNSTVMDLRSGSQRTVAALNQHTGASFDRAYMQAQVDMHQWLLTNLDSLLIPSARSADVRALLTDQRASVAVHLDRARQILQGLR